MKIKEPKRKKIAEKGKNTELSLSIFYQKFYTFFSIFYSEFFSYFFACIGTFFLPQLFF